VTEPWEPELIAIVEAHGGIKNWESYVNEDDMWCTTYTLGDGSTIAVTSELVPEDDD
jgi:hypothetical protein